VAVAVYGQHAELESTDAILGLLKTEAILLLFSPSTEFLELLKTATRTQIDLPTLELEDGAPLIVYKSVSTLKLLNPQTPQLRRSASLFQPLRPGYASRTLDRGLRTAL